MSKTAPLVTGTDFVTLPVSSVETAKAFYEGVLGIPCTARFGDVGVEFETGNLTLAAYDMAKLGREPTSSTGAVALQVADVASAREQLEARGVAFTADIVDSGVCHQAYFTDPDGNPLILHHRYAPKEA